MASDQPILQSQLVTPGQHTHTLTHLDTMRGIAAIAVVLFHLREVFFAQTPNVIHWSLLAKGFYFISAFGHQSVMIFFVLSGFLISSSVMRSILSAKWAWGKYINLRLTRLYVVLIPALCLGALLDRVGISSFGTHNIYGLAFIDPNFSQHSILARLTLPIWLGNLFFLQRIWVPQFGSNDPLWSLSYEFWYYLLFPLLALALTRNTTTVKRLMFAIAALGILIFIGKEITFYFLIWLLGTVLFYSKPSAISRSKVYGVLTFVAFLFSLVAVPRLVKNSYIDDSVLALAITAFLYYVLSLDSRNLSTRYKKAATGISNISYTEYLVHYPFFAFLSAWIVKSSGKWQPTYGHLGESFVILCLTFGYILVVWRIAEANTAKIRSFLSNPARRPADTTELTDRPVA